MRYCFIALVILLITVGVSAQDDPGEAERTCAAFVRTGIINASLECNSVQNGQLCAGGTPATLIDSDEDDEEIEDDLRLGETVSLSELALIETAGINIEDDEWGITRARYSVGTVPVTLVTTGAVSLQDLGISLPTVPVEITSRTGAFVRQGPSTDAEIIEPLIVGQEVVANARLEENAWLRVELPDGRAGWVFTPAVTLLDGAAFTDLPVVDPDETPSRIYRSLWAFSFRSGIRDEACVSAPESGVLLQTGDTETEIELAINGTFLEFAGTLFLQARSEDELTAYVLEGQASLLYFDQTAEVDAGERIILDEDETLTTERYDYTRMETLPVELLGRDFVIATDWQSAFTPSEPNPLAGIDPDNACTITVPEAVNVRVGPGRDYLKRGDMLEDQTAQPDGRAPGTDGRVWWRIVPGAWVNFDVTLIAGACTEVPLIEVVPRLALRGE